MKTRINSIVLLLVVLLTGTGFSTSAQKGAKADSIIYRQAIVNAMSPEPSKIYSGLIEIVPTNKNLTWKTINGEQYLLVASWTKNPQYYQPYVDSPFYNTGNYEIWITTSPQLITRFRSEHVTDTNRRLQQMLGLPPNSVYTNFVEFWVRPQDLFRPCADNEITDNACGLCFPGQTDPTYKTWVDGNRVSRYYPCDLYNKYPWTQLGYTYDWNPKNLKHIGLSEFVIGKNKSVVVNAVYTTSQYLNQQIPGPKK